MATPYRDFRIHIQQSPESNDHQVRFFGDGDDIIARSWSGMIGLDPDDVLLTPSPLVAQNEPHKATVARCGCGEIGCGSVEVEIERCGDEVKWSWQASESQQSLSFLASSYDAELRRAQGDTSWETPDRTSARLLANQVDRQILAAYGLVFAWESGRVRTSAFSVCLELKPGPYQILVHVPWNGESPEEIAAHWVEFLRQPPSTWTGAEWFPQQPNLGPPSLAGPKWRRG